MQINMQNTNNPLNLYILVDRTGSMQTRWVETINMLNSYMDSLKETSVKITLAFFDKNFSYPNLSFATVTNGTGYFPNQTFTINNANNPVIGDPILQIKLRNSLEWVRLSATDQSIAPRGSTPLYDAIGQMAAMIKSDGLKKKDLVQVVVLSDGGENASTEFSREHVRKILNKYQKKQWNVLYLGANFDGFAGGQDVGSFTGTLGIYNSAKWNETATVMSASTMRYATSHNLCSATLSADERKNMA